MKQFDADMELFKNIKKINTIEINVKQKQKLIEAIQSGHEESFQISCQRLSRQIGPYEHRLVTCKKNGKIVYERTEKIDLDKTNYEND